MGGSFDPPHEGHMHLAMQALTKLKLDYVWWLFTPQNPLKKPLNIPEINDRIKMAETKFSHPKMIFTGIESEFKTNYTYETVTKMQLTFPQTKFVWVAGMDNTEHFHKWERWQDLCKKIPIALFLRPPLTQTVKQTRLRQFKKIDNHFSPREDLKAGSVYWLLDGPTINISSTTIRETLQN